tara:strand:+ start:429 stop:824 length:396 start_codon:yes stop_codon:yes gene_type:complete
MSMTDPIADYLTRIRNALQAQKKWVDIPSSNLKIRVSYILREERFIRDYALIKDDKQNILRIFLSYNEGDPIIKGLKRISTPGCRNYVSIKNIPRVLNGLGISILTTSRGVMSDKKARKYRIGGEVLCQVW